LTKNIHHILVGFDGSEQSKKALKHARSLADFAVSRVTVMQVFEPSTFSPSDTIMLEAIKKFHKEEDMRVRKEIRELTKQLDFPETVTVDILTKRGTPKRDIVAFAKHHQVDLIVVGATGTHGVERVLIGSTTSYILNHAHCNVLIVK